MGNDPATGGDMPVRILISQDVSRHREGRAKCDEENPNGQTNAKIVDDAVDAVARFIGTARHLISSGYL